MSPGRATPCRERPEAVKPWRRAVRTPGARRDDALRVPFTTARPMYRGPPSCLTARGALSRVPPCTVNATGRVGHSWAGLATAGQVRARAAHQGRVGARRVRCRVVRVAYIMPPKVPRPGARGHWARSGEFMRIQSDPDNFRVSRWSTHGHQTNSARWSARGLWPWSRRRCSAHGARPRRTGAAPER